MTTIIEGQLIPTAQINQWCPPGVILDYAGATPPDGWLICDGSAINRTTYADLFAALGTTHGAGDGSTTFNLPDCRGRITVGYAPSGGHTDVSTLGAHDAQAVAFRRPKHQTTDSHGLSTSANWVHAGSNTVTGISFVETYTGGHDLTSMPITLSGSIGTGNANDNVDAASYIVLHKIIRAKDA